MEVETRVSVQAIKGRFEQLYEDGPQSPTAQYFPAAPVSRPRTTSLPKRETPRSEDVRKTSAHLVAPVEVRSQDKSGAIRTKSVSTGEAPNLVLFSSAATKSTITPRKHSRYQREHLETQTSHAPLQGELNQKLEQNTVTSPTDVKPRVVRRTPVFKSLDTQLNSDSKKSSNLVDDASVDEPQGIRGRIFTHIRSRSHGNFNVKRDTSVERNMQGKDKNSAVHKENLFNRDWLTPKRKQKSTDNLLYNQDSNSNSSFEGKQKLVAHVVKNMKNRDKPTVLRKLSFSSKMEKEIKHMKEKSINPESKARTGYILSSKNNNLHVKQKTSGRTADMKDPTDRRKRNIQYNSPDSVVVPIAIAKEVADVALKKSGTVTIETDEISEDYLTVPPSRPPRRRSGSQPSTQQKKKGKAPTPPDLFSLSPNTQRHRMNECTLDRYNLSDEEQHNIGMYVMDPSLGFSCSPSATTQRSKEHLAVYQSTESLVSSNSADKSRDSSPVMMTIESSLSFTDIVTGSHTMDSRTSPAESRNISYEIDKVFRSELPSVQLQNGSETKNGVYSKSQRNFESDTSSEIQGLPAGPPPKKPPRTFAYDIYKNFKPTRHEGEMKTNEVPVDKKNNASKNCSSPPIYAVPVKKKSKCNNFSPKPPIRSKSDLSKQDVAKPSVAPKPPHVLAKAKRTSLVDPLISYEKEEEAAVTSEFQRQAHVRYSLRRPKKQAPIPPTFGESEVNNIEDSQNSSNTYKSENDSSYSINNQSNEQGDNSYHQKSCCSDGEPVEYQNIQYRTSKSPEVRKRPHSNSFFPSSNILRQKYENIELTASPVGTPSFSAHNLQTPSTLVDSEQPVSLGYCSTRTSTPETAGLFTKRSMSDETLYKGSRRGEEPVYATPVFNNISDSSDQSGHRELHYMCSVLFTDEEEEGGGAGRDRSVGDGRARRDSKDKILGTETADGSKLRSGMISAWKKEFRQSCRQMQNKLKKTVIR